MSTSTADLVGNGNGTENGHPPTTSFKKMTWREKVRYVKNFITVEPIIACYLIPSVLCGPALNQLELEKACKSNAGFNDSICDSIIAATGDFRNETAEVQRIVADMHSWQGPLQSFTPLILVLFLGSYSDRHKLRKPFMLLPIFGEFFAVAGCILCAIFMREWPLEVQGFAQTVVPSFLGGQTMIVMAVFAYIADVSTVEMRTLRIGVVQIVLNVCYPLVQSFSAVLFQQIGYVPTLCLAALVYLIGLLYGLFLVKEPRSETAGSNSSKKNLLLDIFDSRLVVETISVLLKAKRGNKRAFIVGIMVVLFISAGVTVGEVSLIFLYTNFSFNWTVVEFTYFATVNTLLHLAGTAVALPLFTKLFKLSDYMIMLAAFVDKILCNLIMAFSGTVVGFYVATAVSVIVGIGMVGIRSAATKVVADDDLGKAQSLFGIMEALAPAVSFPAFNKLYEVTIETYPAAFFIIGCALFLVACLLVIVMHFKEQRAANRVDVKEKNNVEMNNDVEITRI